MNESQTTLGWIAAGIYACAVLGSVIGVWVLPLVGVAATVFVAYKSAQGGSGAPASIKFGSARVGSGTVDSGQRCPLCREDFQSGDLAESCPCCETVYHHACGKEFQGCATLGCRAKVRNSRAIGVKFRVDQLTPKLAPTSGERPRIRISAHPISGRLTVDEGAGAAA